MTLTELFSFLEEIQAKPKKSLSQNFLIDPNIVLKIVRIAQVQPDEEILEIGPGPGALTRALLNAGAHVTAVEKDFLFAEKLHRFGSDRLRVIQDDVLEYPLPKGAKIVANLPYHITTPILEKIFAIGFHSCTLMVQKEMADRLMAKAGTKQFSSLSLFLQFHGKITDSFHVSPQCFFPQPQVDSTVIRIESITPPLPNPEPLFKWIRRAFQQRRKMMSSSLNELAPAEVIRDTLEAAGLRRDARPEMLSLTEWLKFFELMNQTTFVSA